MNANSKSDKLSASVQLSNKKSSQESPLQEAKTSCDKNSLQNSRLDDAKAKLQPLKKGL